jgi:cytochrome c oxidase assembly factor CtaG
MSVEDPARALVAPLILTLAGLYARGWRVLRGRMPERFSAARLVAFLAGLAIALVALVSPLHDLAGRRLWAHMVQHMLLMTATPPLVWLGTPWAPLLLGLPVPVRRAVAGMLGTLSARRIGSLLSGPVLAWLAFSVAFWAWHTPALYDLALRSSLWHHVEHACFGATGMLFWRPVVAPWPARPIWPRWAIVAYLLLADAQNTALAAILTFADRVIYPAYEAGPRPWDGAALEDQSVAGVIMWVPGSIVFLIAAACVVLAGLRPRRGEMREAQARGAVTAGRTWEY